MCLKYHKRWWSLLNLYSWFYYFTLSKTNKQRKAKPYFQREQINGMIIWSKSKIKIKFTWYGYIKIQQTGRSVVISLTQLVGYLVIINSINLNYPINMNQSIKFGWLKIPKNLSDPSHLKGQCSFTISISSFLKTLNFNPSSVSFVGKIGGGKMVVWKERREKKVKSSFSEKKRSKKPQNTWTWSNYHQQSDSWLNLSIEEWHLGLFLISTSQPPLFI